MTDIEKLMEDMAWLDHSFNCNSNSRKCSCGLTEARKLAARVAEWVADATIRLDERRKWVNELREENATLRAQVEELEKQIRHRCKNGIGEDARCILIQGHDGNCHLIHRDSYSGWHSEPTTDEGEN